ncbi:MAG: hypothetical protein BZ138_04455 [Methanosphaera sp. rholeuAM270]|nr:MAG: hypothetical protein BZ138_04455 [Methanosphaera sp. rholeuAM270]
MQEDELFKNKIGVIGAGNIGRAIILKLLEKNYPYDNICLTYNGSIFTFNSIYDNNLVDMISSNSEIVKISSILVLAVPPQSFKLIGDFNLDDDTLVISFMAGIKTEDIMEQTGSANVVRIIPTGPDTIMNSEAVAGVYGDNEIAESLFELLDIDYVKVDDEENMDYVAIAGCLPVVYCKVSPDSNECREAINMISEDFPDFKVLAKKCEKLVPENNHEEFINKFTTPGGVTQAILNGFLAGKSVYDSLLLGIERNRQLAKQ